MEIDQQSINKEVNSSSFNADSSTAERLAMIKEEHGFGEFIYYLTQDYKKKALQLEQDIKSLKEKVYRKGLEKAINKGNVASFVNKYGKLDSVTEEYFDFHKYYTNRKWLEYSECVTNIRFTECSDKLENDGDTIVRRIQIAGETLDVKFKAGVKLMIPVSKHEENSSVSAEVDHIDANVDEVTYNELHQVIKVILESRSLFKFFQGISQYSEIRRNREDIYGEIMTTYPDLIIFPDGPTGFRIQFYIGNNKMLLGEIGRIVELTPLMTLTERLEFNIIKTCEISEEVNRAIESLNPQMFNKLVEEFGLLNSITMIMECVKSALNSSQSSG